VNTTDNGSVNISGNSTDGDGVDNNGSLNASGNGSINVTGNTSNGTGVDNNGPVNTTDNSSVNISGNSTDGDGVDNNGPLNASDNSSINVTGNTSNGTGVDNNGPVNTTDNSSVNISGNSTDGDGVNNNASLNASDNSSINVTGYPTVSINTDEINTQDNGTANICDNSGCKDFPDNNSSNVSGNSTDGGGSDNNGVLNVSGNLTEGGRASSSHGSSYAPEAVAAGVWGVTAAIVGLTHEVWTLENPQVLTLDAGDTSLTGSTLQSVLVDHDADVSVQTSAGVANRHLAYRDASDGVRHYALDDGQTHAQLSFNPQSHEYFYREQGVNNGKPYTVTSHGWLKESVRLGVNVK
jgi:hypothetical protein